MQRIQLAEDLQFSRVIHGLWRLNEWNYSDAELLSLIEWCIDHGITTFDHADIYGAIRAKSCLETPLPFRLD